MTDVPEWVARARAAASGVPQPRLEVLRGARPPLLARDAVHAGTSVLLAALVVSAALLRSRIAPPGFDLVLLLLRSTSFAFCLRALIAIVLVARRLASARGAAARALVVTDEGLYLRAGDDERWAARQDVLGVGLPEEPTTRGALPSLAPLYLVLHPRAGLSYWTLPPYFSTTNQVLAARLRRWLERGDPTPVSQREQTKGEAAEARYRRAARGALKPGELAVPEGFGYRLRAPYGALLALVFVADALSAAGPARTRVLPAAALATLLVLATLLGWFVWVRRRRAARLGIALLLTPDELLARGRHGVLAIGWRELAQVEVAVKLAWSPYVGSYPVRILWFGAVDGTHLALDEAFLGAPAAVVEQLALAYRGVDAGAAAAPASQGSGAGGEISGRAGTTASARSAT